MNGKIAATVTLHAKPGKMAGLKQATKAFVDITRQEAGCEVFTVSQVIDDPELFILWEVFSSEQALQEHFAKEYTQEYFHLDLFTIISNVRHIEL